MKKMLWLVALTGGLALVACTDEHLYHQLTVSGGSGTGEYRLGTRVTITADPPPAEQGFFAWAGDTAFLEQVRAPLATLTMPLQDVSITATYKNLPKYELTVTNGTGSGTYLEGTAVRVAAAPPADNLLFTAWAGDTLFLSNAQAAEATVTMPAQAIAIMALFEELVNEVSFSKDILPLFQRSCSYAGCHDAYYSTPLTNYQEIWESRLSSREQILSGKMPSAGPPLSPEEIEMYLLWMEQGAKNN